MADRERFGWHLPLLDGFASFSGYDLEVIAPLLGSKLDLAWREQALNCLYVFALVDEKRREAVTEVVEAESLTALEPDPSRNHC